MLLGGPFPRKFGGNWRISVKSMKSHEFLWFLWFFLETDPPKSTPDLTFSTVYVAPRPPGPIFTQNHHNLAIPCNFMQFHRKPGPLCPGGPRSLIPLRNINGSGRSVSAEIWWELKNFSKIRRFCTFYYFQSWMDIHLSEPMKYYSTSLVLGGMSSENPSTHINDKH